jgi:hypothetical protein
VIRKQKKTCDEKSAIQRSNETKKKAALASVRKTNKHALYINTEKKKEKKTKLSKPCFC